MATTTNYGWTTPDDSALVKDGASAIRTLGSSVDTTVKALSPGTTSGDIDYYTSSTAKARLAIGSTGQVLTVSGGVPAWATSSSGGMTLLSTTTLSGVTTTISGISASYTQLLIRILNPVFNTAGQQIRLAINGGTAVYGNRYNSSSPSIDTMGSYITPGVTQDNTGGGMINSVLIDSYSNSNRKSFVFFGVGIASGSYRGFGGSGGIGISSAVSSIAIDGNNAYSFTGGTVEIWGIK